MTEPTLNQYYPGGVAQQLMDWANGNNITQNMAAMSRGAALGCSHEAHAIGAIAGGNFAWTTGGWIAWLRRYAKGAIDFPMANIFATTGFTSTQILNTWLAPCLAAKPAWCFVDIFPNDPTSGVSYATSIANAQSIITQLQNAGIYPILVPVRIPASGWAGWSAAVTLQFSRLNQWVKTYCENNVGITYWDANPSFLDFSTGYSQSSLLQADFLHENAAGAQLRGLSAWNLISSLFPARDNRFMLLGDTYDATNNPTGTLLANGLMAGTTGVIAGGAGTTGSVATSWNVFNGSTTVAASKTAYPNVTNLFKQTFTLSGTADNNDNAFYQSVSGWSIGDTLIGEAEADWNITSGSITAIWVQIQANSIVIAGDNMVISGTPYGNLSTGAQSTLVLRTDPVVIPAGTTTITYALGYTTAAGAVSAVVNFARASLRKK